MPRYKLDKELGEFIPIAEWDEKFGKEIRRSAMIMKDIESFISPIDGTVISSRPKLEAHNKKHGVTNIKDYAVGHFEKRGKEMILEATGQTPEAKKERCQLIDKTLNDFGV